MHQGNWTCSQCGGAIKELPFQPRSNSGLTCRDCYFKKKDGGTGGSGGGGVQAAPADTGDGADLDDRTDVPDFDPMGGGASDAAPTPPDFADAAPAAERKMHTGDWSCSGCGNAITSLPFEPRSTENLKCIDCFKKSKS